MRMRRYDDEPEFEDEWARQEWIAAGGQRQGDSFSAFSPD